VELLHERQRFEERPETAGDPAENRVSGPQTSDPTRLVAAA
jgi:hypothetical protein